MDDSELQRRLRALSPPDAQATQARARELVLAAHARPRAHRRRLPIIVLALTGLTAVLVTAGATRGPAVAHWVKTTFQAQHTPHPAHQETTLTSLPGGGRLLVASGRKTWIVGDGNKHRISLTAGTTAWSAFGHYIAHANRDRLEALNLHGHVMWIEQLNQPIRVPGPIWSPDGNRIAFQAGTTLYITAADGSALHALPPTYASPTALAWRPGPNHQLLIATHRRLTLLNTDQDEIIWQHTLPAPAVSLSWSQSGRRALLATQRALRLYDQSGHQVEYKRSARGWRTIIATLSPSGRQIALLQTNDDREEALLQPVAAGSARHLLVGKDLSPPYFSPNGRWILLQWPELGQDSWLFFPTTGRNGKTRQIADLEERLANASTPTIEGWCCSETR